MSDCVSGTVTSVTVVPVVTDVPVSPSSVLTEVCDGFSLGSDGEFWWNRSPLLCPKKRAHLWTVEQEEMRYESSPAKAPPPTKLAFSV